MVHWLVLEPQLGDGSKDYMPIVKVDRLQSTHANIRNLVFMAVDLCANREHEFHL